MKKEEESFVLFLRTWNGNCRVGFGQDRRKDLIDSRCIDLVAMDSFKSLETVADVALIFVVEAQSVLARIRMAEIDADRTIGSGESLSALAADRSRFDLIGLDDGVVGMLAETRSAVQARTRQDIYVQLEMNGRMTRIGYGQAERFAVDRGQGVGHGPPPEHARFSYFGFGQRIGQPEVKRIRIDNRHRILEQLSVIGGRFQPGGNDRRMIERIRTPRLRLAGIAALARILRINFARRITAIVQIADILPVGAQWPTVLFRQTGSTAGMVNSQTAGRRTEPDAVVADTDLDVQFLADVVQHLVMAFANRQMADDRFLINKLGPRRNGSVVVAVVALPSRSVKTARLDLATQPRGIDKSAAGHFNLAAIGRPLVAQSVSVANSNQSRRSIFKKCLF